MQFGVSGSQRESVAVAAGIWGAADTISGDGPYVYTGDGSQTGVTFWEMEGSAPVPIAPVAAQGMLVVAIGAGAALMFRNARRRSSAG